MSKPLAYSKQEIESCIMAGITRYEEDKKNFGGKLGSSDKMAVLGASWKQIPPDGRAMLKKQQPDVYKQAISLFGE